MPAIRLAIIFLLTLGLLSGQQADPNFDSGKSEAEEPANASLELSLNSYGNLKILIWVDNGDKKIDLLSIPGSRFKCMNTELSQRFVECSATGYIPADGQIHELNLTPIFSSLRSAGIPIVTATLDYKAAKLANKGNWQQNAESLSFDTEKQKDLPSAIQIQLDPPPSLLLPVLIVLLLPFGLTMIIKRSDSGQFAWLNCLINGIWFYWIWAWRPSVLAEFLETQSWANSWNSYLIGVVLAALPPLIAISGAIYLLRQNGEALRMIVLQNAQQMIPLAIFIAGAGHGTQVFFASIGLAYIAHHTLEALVTRQNRGLIREVLSGQWFDRVAALSAAASVKLDKLLLYRSGTPQAINAYAIPGNRVMLSESMIQQFSPSEIDSIVGHELAHLKQGDGAVQLLFWAVYWFAGTFLISIALPEQLRHYPVSLILGTLLFAKLSQFHEFRADSFSAKLSGDPESTIAALGRVAQLTRSGLRWNRLAGWILTHPSMELRALRLSKEFGVPADRALAILENPDLIRKAGEDVHNLSSAIEAENASVPIPHDLVAVESVLTQPATDQFVKQLSWVMEAVILATLLLASSLIGWFLKSNISAHLFQPEGFNYLRYFYPGLFLFSIPLSIFAAYLANLGADAWERRQFAAWERELRQRLQPPPQARFVGLRPGSGIFFPGGFLDWDLGFLHLNETTLSYSGERMQFELPATSIWQVELQSSRTLWKTIKGVHIQSASGSFGLREPLAANEWKPLLQTLEAWWQAHPATNVDAARESQFPKPENLSFELSLLLYVAWKMCKLLVLAALLTASIVPTVISGTPLFFAPLAWLLVTLPEYWRVLRQKTVVTKFHPNQPARLPSPSPAMQDASEMESASAD